MIEILAYSINYIILFLFLVCVAIALYLFRKSRQLPREMKSVIQKTANEWNLDNLADASIDGAKVLEGLKLFVETSDAERRAELRGYLKGGDDKADLNTSGISTARNLSKILTEIFPLLGILGTVSALSVAVGMTGSQSTPSVDMISDFLSLFGTAVDSTIYGISSGVLFMLVFGAIDSKLDETFDLISRYREILDRALLLSYGLGE